MSDPLWEPSTPAQQRWFEREVARAIDGLNNMLVNASERPPHDHNRECLHRNQEPWHIPVEDDPEDEEPWHIPVEDDPEDESPDEGMAGV